MTAVLAWLATYAVHSTLLLLAVALLTTHLVRRHAWREVLWKAALLGGLLTATLQLAFDLRPVVGRWEMSGSTMPDFVPGLAATVEAEQSAPPRPSRERRGQAPPAPGQDIPRPPSQAPRLPSWSALLLVAWGVIATWGIARLAHRHLRLRRLLGDRIEVTDAAILSMLALLRRNAGVWRPVRITTTSRATTPFAIGDSEICLPEGLFDQLTTEERRCALAHELAHLARRDPGWQLVAGLMKSIFFFQPLNSLAARRMRESAEYLSDDWAVRQTDSALGLARCLAVVASWVVPDAEHVQETSMAMVEGGSPLLRRVRRLLERRHEAQVPHAGARLIATAAILVVVAGAAPGVALQATGRHVEVPPGGIRGEAVRVHYAPDTNKPLSARFAWMLAEAGRRHDREAWVAYEVRSALAPNRSFGTDSQRAPEDQARRSPRGVVLHSSRDRSRDPDDPDLVVMLRLRADPEVGWSVLRVAGRTPSGEFDPGALPVYWLDAAGGRESVALLASLEPQSADLQVWEKLVSVIAVHRDPSTAVSHLLEILYGDHPMNVRGAAAEGLAWHPSPAALAHLRKVALGDRSTHVRREAIEALGQAGGSEAEATLDEIIGSATAPLGTRTEAVEALGAFHQPDVLRKLTGIAFGAYEREIQDEAAETVADLDVPEALPVLKQIAFAHPDSNVRREVVEPLAETGRRADLETLLRIALGDPSPHVQREATKRLADFSLADAAPLLARVVWEHENAAVRHDALRQIAAMPEAVGLPLLDAVVASHPDGALRRQALAAIGRYGDERSTRRLVAIARADPDSAIRHQARALLARRQAVATWKGAKP